MTRRLLRRPSAVVSLAWLTLVVVAVLLAEVIAPGGPLRNDLADVLSGPTAAHPLGTDQLGRDVLARLLYGGRNALLGVVEAVATFVLIGSCVGLAAGFLGGWPDRITAVVTDVVMSLPSIIILLVVLSVFPHDEHLAMVALGVLGAPLLVRVMRSAARSAREQLYVSAARVAGLTDLQILVRHIAPRVSATIVVQASFFAGIALVTQTGLSFLGLGAEAPNPSWGGSIADAAQVIQRQPWLLVPGGVTIALTVLALGVLGDALRDVSTERWSVSRLAPRRSRGAAGFARVATLDPELRETAPGDALLAVDGLCVELERDGVAVPVVDGVSFDVRPGETVGLVGESGCGKSVTALSLLGLVPGSGHVVGGSIRFGDRDLARCSERDFAAVRGSEIALVSQEPMVALDPTFTVRQQLVEAVRRHHGCSRQEASRRALELLERVRLPDPSDVARRYPHQLSGGMAQRVCIALALAGEPRLLIADEPTTALDVTVQAQILDLLRSLQQETGMSILLVTHDWGVVADLCQRTIVMYAGHVVERGPIERIFAAPAHPYTKGLLESDPHVALDQRAAASRGRPDGAGERTLDRLPTIPGLVPQPGEWPVGCHFHPRCPLAQDDCRSAPVALQEVEEHRRVSRCLHWQALVEEETYR